MATAVGSPTTATPNQKGMTAYPALGSTCGAGYQPSSPPPSLSCRGQIPGEAAERSRPPPIPTRKAETVLRAGGLDHWGPQLTHWGCQDGGFRLGRQPGRADRRFPPSFTAVTQRLCPGGGTGHRDRGTDLVRSKWESLRALKNSDFGDE